MQYVLFSLLYSYQSWIRNHPSSWEKPDNTLSLEALHLNKQLMEVWMLPEITFKHLGLGCVGFTDNYKLQKGGLFNIERRRVRGNSWEDYEGDSKNGSPRSFSEWPINMETRQLIAGKLLAVLPVVKPRTFSAQDLCLHLEEYTLFLKRGTPLMNKNLSFTFTKLGEQQKLALPGIRLFFSNWRSRAELDNVRMTRKLFLGICSRKNFKYVRGFLHPIRHS